MPTKSFWDPLKKCTVSRFTVGRALPNDKYLKLVIDTEVLFRWLLTCKIRNVDLWSVIRYEIAAVPPALFYDDGTMRKTNKDYLAQKLEPSCPDVLTELPQTSASTSSAYIIDGMAAANH